MNLIDALIQQESGGRPGVMGQATKYGTAIGMTQMLPATAQQMAQKLGIQWNPQLLSGKTPDAAAYQRQLGEAYLNEGMEKTGNTRDALRYYHGGPDRALWGPKTNAYADNVLARMNGKSMPQPQQPAPNTLAGLVNQQAPVDAMGQGPLVPQQAQTLGELAGTMPQVAPKKGPLGLSKNQWAAMLAALSDAGYRMSGVQSNNLGAFQQGQQKDEEQQFDRDKWAQALAVKREQLLAGPKPTQTDRYVQEVLDPHTDPRRAALLRSILTHPLGIMSYGSDGSATQNFYNPDQAPGAASGDDDWEYSN